MHRVIVFAAVSVAAMFPLCAQELIYTPGKTMGLENVPPPERNRWKARMISPAGFRDAPLVECREADFFTLEYGSPLKPFALKLDEKGEASRLWGERAGAITGQAIRYGRGWNSHLFEAIEVRADIEQDCEGEIEWSLVLHTRTAKRSLVSFKTKAGANDVRKDIGMIRIGNPLEDGGLELVAKGASGASVKVKGLRILPVIKPIFFRRTFELKEVPWRAGISFFDPCGARLTVNGKAVSGVRRAFAEDKVVAKIDITKMLRAGRNEVVIETNGYAGWDRKPERAIELFAVAPDGTLDFFPSNDQWEARNGNGEWMRPRVGGVYGVSAMPNGTKYATGFMPFHAGPLVVTPHGTRWPVFDETKEIAWDASLPPKMEGVKVRASVRNVLTGAAATAAEGKDKLVFKGLKTGAYEIEWALLRGDEVVDSDCSEMIVTGRLNLEEFKAEEVEKELRKRMRLVDEIDCTSEPAEGEFLDHTGYFGKHVTNVGCVTERDGFKVRETGPGRLDILSWHIKCGKLGAPHVVEVDFPDTREQYVYASVSETFPLSFRNNYVPVGSRSWPSGSGAAFCGNVMPLSGKMKTLRFTFFPGSRNLTFNVENGVYGKPAGICRVRVYEVEGTLPSMRIPQTERIYGNHIERPLFYNWGGALSPFMNEICFSGSFREGMWTAAYLALVNRIQFLKFAGHNAAVEGVFMYTSLFKTESGNSLATDVAFDLNVPMLMMYRANGIRPYLSFEYNSVPALMSDKLRSSSDREVAAGKDTISFVDRFGRQSLCAPMGGAMNFLRPEVSGSMVSLLREIYDRYEPLGVEGVVVVSEGCAWQPCFGGISWKQDKDETGYDDFTVGLFERECGVSLGVDDKGPKRFAARYDRIHADGGLLAKWRDWRFAKIAEANRKMAAAVQSRTPWRYILSPSVELSDASGYTRALYPKGGSVDVLMRQGFGKEWQFDTYERAFADDTRETIHEWDALRLSSSGLNEHNWSKVDGAKKWWWRSYGVIVYDLKPVGENAMFDCVTAFRDYTPKTLFHTWLDVNLTTGHDAMERRFLKGFYSTPVGEPKPYPGARGVVAHVYGDKLQLLNPTPYGIVEKGGKLRVGPFGIVVLDTPRPVEFALSPEGKDALIKIRETMGDSRVREALDAKTLARWDSADDYGQMLLSREYAIMEKIRNFDVAQKGFPNQAKFEAALAKDGVARVNCGHFGSEKADETGAKWLPDQRDTGFRAYGFRNATFASRGNIEIRRTDRPSIYRTESSNERNETMSYRFPVPEGTYRVRVHMADTFWKEDQGSEWKFGIGDDVRSFNIWKLADGKGRTAVVTTFENVKPVDGAIKIEFISALVNGIEIEKEKK